MCGGGEEEEEELEETEEEGGTVKRAIDLDRLIGDWTADKRERAKEERDSFLPSFPHSTHHYKRQKRERRTLSPLPRRAM